jgi:hypothetical protein
MVSSSLSLNFFSLCLCFSVCSFFISPFLFHFPTFPQLISSLSFFASLKILLLPLHNFFPSFSSPPSTLSPLSSSLSLSTPFYFLSFFIHFYSYSFFNSPLPFRLVFLSFFSHSSFTLWLSFLFTSILCFRGLFSAFKIRL